VYNAAVHVGRGSVIWHRTLECAPGDPTARDVALAAGEGLPSGVEPAELARWAHAALDAMSVDEARSCFHHHAAGGAGTLGMWAWHAASEFGVHRIDVEQALGHELSMTDEQAADAVSYVCGFVLPAMSRVTGENPGVVEIELQIDRPQRLRLGDGPSGDVTVTGRPVEVLLALWGRPHSGVDLDGDTAVWDRWRQLPGIALQFGAWD